MLNNMPLNGNVYLPVCYICNSRFINYYETMGRKVCGPCLKLPPGDFRAELIKADERAGEVRYKKD